MSMRDSKPGRCIPRGHGRGRTVAGARSSEPRSDRTYRGAARFQPRCSRTRRARGHGRRASVCGSRMMIRCRTQRAMERTGPRGADPRRGTSRFGAGSRTRHGTQWASEAQASCGADRFGTGFRTRQALWGVGALMIRRCRSTRAVSNRCGLLEPTRESGAPERTGSDGAARRGLSRIGAGFWSRRGVRGVGAHRLRRCRSTWAVSNRCGPQNAFRDSGSDGAARRGLSRIGAGFRTAFRGTSSVCGPDSAWERMRGTIRDAWSEWTARSG